jgi:hypothetical protein
MTRSFPFFPGLLLAVISLAQLSAQDEPPPAATNHVLQLDGDGDYVELPGAAFSELETVTIEAWVKWDEFRMMSRVFDFVLKDRGVNLYNAFREGSLKVEQASEGKMSSFLIPHVLPLGQWIHLALVVEEESLKLYYNGVHLEERAMAELDAGITTATNLEQYTRLNLLGRGNARLCGPRMRISVGKSMRCGCGASNAAPKKSSPE